jgi:hypothetical protein
MYCQLEGMGEGVYYKLPSLHDRTESSVTPDINPHILAIQVKKVHNWDNQLGDIGRKLMLYYEYYELYYPEFTPSVTQLTLFVADSP